MATECLVFDDVSLIKHGYYELCSLTISSRGFEIRNLKTGRQELVSPDDVKSVSWCQMAKRFGLKIVAEGALFYQIAAMNPQDFDRIAHFLSSKLNIVLKTQELSVKGKNQGDLSIEASSMRFMVDLGTCFEIPFKDICRVSSGKNEIGVEFHNNENAPVSLMEIRMHVPNESVPRLVSQLSSKADVMKATSDAIFCLKEVSCLTPRGRYTLKIYPTFVELHGKTFDLKIPHSTIIRIFALRYADQKTHIVVFSIDPPLRQGQTRYPFIVINFENQPNPYAPALTDSLEPDQEEKAVHESFSELVGKLSQKTIQTPGTFKSHFGSECISCAFKASNGFLYPLDRGFLFVHKPTLYFRFEEISCIDFARGTLSARTFDVELNLRTGQTMLFNNIERENYRALSELCSSKDVKIRKSAVCDKDGQADRPISASPGANLEESDEEDDDYNPVKESSSSSNGEEQAQSASPDVTID